MAVAVNTSRVLAALEEQWSFHAVTAAQLRSAANALMNYRVVDAGTAPDAAAAASGKMSRRGQHDPLPLAVTDHIPFDVVFRGGAAVTLEASDSKTIVAAGSASGVPPTTPSEAISTVSDWLTARNFAQAIDCEYPVPGNYVPVMKRPVARKSCAVAFSC